MSQNFNRRVHPERTFTEPVTVHESDGQFHRVVDTTRPLPDRNKTPGQPLAGLCEIIELEEQGAPPTVSYPETIGRTHTAATFTLTTSRSNSAPAEVNSATTVPAAPLRKTSAMEIGNVRKVVKTPRFMDHKEGMVLSYWMQLKEETDRQRKVMTRYELLHQGSESSSFEDQEKREDQANEMRFILDNFRERRCKNFSKRETLRDRMWQALSKTGGSVLPRGQHCKCGLERRLHRQSALEKEVRGTTWQREIHTELVPPHSFGNVDVPNHNNYLETPEGTRKYLRLDDLVTKPRRIWELLRKAWRLKPPNIVISVTGGDVSELQHNTELQKDFREGLLRTAVTTDAWVITEGLYAGASKEVADTFQEDLKNSVWSDEEDHANIPLIGIPPWGILANRVELLGVNLGAEEAEYWMPSLDADDDDSAVMNALDPYHTFFLLADDGTSGDYEAEPRIRRELEHYIKNETSIQLLGARGVRTPLVVLVLGGDTFTLDKVLDATRNEIPVVVVNGSGAIANMLAEGSKRVSISTEETKDIVIQDVCKRYSAVGVITEEEEEKVTHILANNHLIEVFGADEGDTTKLDKTILRAIFSEVSEITVQLSLCLAMDRPDIAKDYVFKETRRSEIKGEEKLLQDALFLALKNGREDFTKLLLDQDHGGQLDFEEFLTVRRLFQLHKANLTPNTCEGKVLLSLCKKNDLSQQILDDYNILSQTGRIIYHMMGGSYKLLYQEIDFERVNYNKFPWNPVMDNWEEAVWHLFIWAILANERKIAELFLSRCSCKIGGALVAYKLLRGISEVATTLAEYELADELMQSAEHFQDAAIQTLTQLYELNRNEAYSSLVAAMPFDFGKEATPISIADDAGAMRFMGHACCQTFLNLIWMKNMDLDTRKWKLFPLFAFFPYLSIPFIKFDPDSLSFGSYEMDPTLKSLGKRDRGDSMVKHGSVVSVRKETDRDVQDDASNVSDTEDAESRIKVKGRSIIERLSYWWFCLVTYYTSPVLKFGQHLLSYLVLLGLFTHFVLSELRPIQSVREVTIFEWLVIIWVCGLGVEEAKQLMFRKSSNPMYEMRILEYGRSWNNTWYIQERFLFFIGWHKIQCWLTDRWNQLDGLMLLSFLASIILRFVLPSVDFYVVRMLYSLTLMLFYFRILRYGYILPQLGPRIITIRAMLRDLFQFILIIAVFIFSFGIAFQALLDPNRPASVNLLVDIVWRPYWQMYGELFLEDLEDAKGTVDNRTCTLSRKEALSDPSNVRLCHSWIVPLLLGVYMLITNILLLNLLIAIFSHSFEIIEEKSEMIWRYNLYDLVHEYYFMTWLAPPLNIIIHVIRMLMWIVNRFRYMCFLIAKWRRKRHLAQFENMSLPNNLDPSNPAEVKNFIDKQAEKDVKLGMCGTFFYDSRQMSKEEISHFCQADYMRDEDVENKAYKRYLRNTRKKKQDRVGRTLQDQTERLQNISTDLHDLKTATALRRRSVTPDSDSQVERRKNGVDMKQLSLEMKAVHDRMNNMAGRIDSMTGRMDYIINLLQSNMSANRQWASPVTTRDHEHGSLTRKTSSFTVSLSGTEESPKKEKKRSRKHKRKSSKELETRMLPPSGTESDEEYLRKKTNQESRA